MPTASQGIDAGRKIAGRKYYIGVDTLGLPLAVWVTAASVSDNTGGLHLLSQIATTSPRVTKPGPTPSTAPRQLATVSELTSKTCTAIPAPKASK